MSKKSKNHLTELENNDIISYIGSRGAVIISNSCVLSVLDSCERMNRRSLLGYAEKSLWAGRNVKSIATVILGWSATAEHTFYFGVFWQ